MPAVSQELIRDMNYHKVLETIINEGSLSRADLSKKLGLTKATISSQVQSLLDDGLICEIGSLETSKGRPPIMLTFQEDCGHVISIDIGINTINLLLSNLLGRKCYSRQYTWNGDDTVLMDLLVLAIRDILTSPRAKQQKIIGICLAIHGVVDNNEIMFTPYYELEHIPFQKHLEALFSIPVFLENEANLSALGEKTFSFGEKNLINISVHSGIGLGFIMDGNLYTGANGFAGEFGHTIVVPDGRPCPCGNKGCIEQYASEAAVLRKYNQLKNTKGYTIDDLVRDYLRQEGAAFFAVSDFTRYMALGINNIVNIFNPQLIVINSSLTSFLPDVIGKIRSLLSNRMSQQCEIVPSLLQDTATLLGGVYLCSKHFLAIENFNPPVRM